MKQDPQEIKELTGYYPGNVYIYDTVKAEKNERFESPERYDDKLTYDKETGNFHITPNNPIYNNICLIEFVGEARKRIIDELEAIISTIKDISKKPSLIKRRGALEQSTVPLQRRIEKWVQVERNGYIYILCFERLYTHKDTVNCMFGLFQFYKYPGEIVNNKLVDKKGVNKDSENKFSMCYPASFKDGKELQKDNRNRIVYNPELPNRKLPSVFELNDNNIKTVCNAFIDFIEKN